MKKLKLAVATSSIKDVWPEYDAWALEVPGLAAWNNAGKYGDYVIKVPWQLMHIPTGTRIESAHKRDQIVAIAAHIAPITDWTSAIIDGVTYARTVLALREWWAVYTEQQRLEAA